MKLNELVSDTWELIIDHPEKTKQGILLWYKGVKYPRRVYYDRKNDHNYILMALDSLGTVKKFLYSLTFLSSVIVPRTFKVTKWNQFARNIYLTAWWNLNPYFLEDDEWSEPVWEIGKIVVFFLAELGFDAEVSVGWAKVIMCFLEFDNAYRYRLQDLITLWFEYKDIGKVLNEYRKREGMPGAGDRLNKLGKMLKYALYLPKLRNAFNKAMQVGIEKIQFNDNDRFHFAFWRGYDYEGKSFEERFNPYAEGYKNAPFRKKDSVEETANFMTE